MLILSDLHLREETADTVCDQILPDVRKIAPEDGTQTIAILGDVFHVRYHVSVRLLLRLRDELNRGGEAGLSYIIIPGNHDQIDVHGRNVLEHLDDLPHVSVYTEPTWDEYGLWFPYRKPELVPELLNCALDLGDVADLNVLFIHHGVKGAWMNDNVQNVDGLELEPYSFGTIVCGHYHRHQKVGKNVWYVGSPYQTRADEAGQPKGYCMWDGNQLTFHEMNWGRKYHKLEAVAGTLDLQGVQPGDEVRVTVKTEVEAEALGKTLSGLEVTHVITVAAKSQEARLAVEDGASLETFAEAYVEASPTELDKKKLLSTFRQIAK